MDTINSILDFPFYFSRHLAGKPKPLEGTVPPKCIYLETSSDDPEFSIVIPIHNQETIIRKNLDAIVENTQGMYELILVIDACSDKTEKNIISWTEKYITLPSNCCRMLIIKSITPLFETAADNVGFSVARGKYLLEIQADMTMTENGYNIILKRPFEVCPNVIGVSGRCCHGLYSGDIIGRGGTDIEKDYDSSLSSEKFYVNETCNRGPLLLEHIKVRELGYLDEQNFYLDDSDHDLFARAWYSKKWICGYVPIHFDAPLVYGSTRRSRDELNTYFLNARKARSNGGFYSIYKKHYIKRNPYIIFLPKKYPF